MLDSIYHMTLRLLFNLISAIKNITILSLGTQRCYVVVYRFYCMGLYHSQMRGHLIMYITIIGAV